ncbi:MAG: hypothetical protein IT285_15565, partial [Bdellovibrionales bacterium]|nr:hypothetical protein [Bdellovibrionales bacterium]
SNGALKLAYATEALTSTTSTWTCLSLDSSGNTRGEGISFVLGSDDSPYLAHFDSTAAQVRYLRCTSAIGTCVTTGGSAFAGESVAATGTATAIITKPSIRVTSDGTVYVAHYSGAFQALAIQSRAPTETAWTASYVDPNDDGGSFTSLAGSYPVLLLNDSENPLVFYRSMENFLKYYSLEQE